MAGRYSELHHLHAKLSFPGLSTPGSETTRDQLSNASYKDMDPRTLAEEWLRREGSPDGPNPLNFIRLGIPQQILYVVPREGFKVFLTGYSAAPKDTGYAESTAKYVAYLADSMKGRKVSLVTSPPATGDSIDAIATMVAHTKNLGILYITAKSSLEYVDPETLPLGVNKAKFTSAPKYYFDDTDNCSQASAMAADMLIVTGGRDVAVQDFMNAVENGNKVIILNNSFLPTGFDSARNRPNNAAEYITSMLAAAAKGE